MSEEQQVQQVQLDTAKYYRSVAEVHLLRAKYDANVSKLSMQRSEIELKTAEAVHHRVVNGNRPSVTLGAKIEQRDGMFYALAAGIEGPAGETPEIAFQNFDRFWSQGYDL